MEPFTLKGTDLCPQVILDPGKGIFELSGRSYPDDVIEVYTPVFQWLKRYAEDPLETTEFKFRMEYFNTASAKIILDILTHFEEMIQSGHQVRVKWYYTREDEDMQQAGKEYAAIVDVPFELIDYQDDSGFLP
jgi:hypothetical protein